MFLVSKGNCLPVLLLTLLAVSLNGCQSLSNGLDQASPEEEKTVYRDDTPIHLIDSFIIAWNAYDDVPVYHFSKPLEQQNDMDRDAFVQNGAEKCRWKADWWGVVREEYRDDRQHVVVDVKMVVSGEGYTSLSTMRFTCDAEGDRWLVSNYEWVGEYLDLRNYPIWLYETAEP